MEGVLVATGIFTSPSKATCVFARIFIVALCGMNNTRSPFLVVGLVVIFSNSPLSPIFAVTQNYIRVLYLELLAQYQKQLMKCSHNVVVVVSDQRSTNMRREQQVGCYRLLLLKCCMLMLSGWLGCDICCTSLLYSRAGHQGAQVCGDIRDSVVIN